MSTFWRRPEADPAGRGIAALSASADLGRPRPVRVAPDGGIDLLFTRCEGRATAEVFGPKTRAVLVHDGAPSEKIAIHLAPGCARRWLGVDAALLRDTSLPLELVWGARAERLAEAMADDGPLAARAARLLGQLPAAAPPSPLDSLASAGVAALARSGGRLRIRQLADALGCGERRLERAFRRAVGLSPKQLARILRFRAAWRELGAGRDQVAAAYRCGYVDQAHLHREFRALLGSAPGSAGPFAEAAGTAGATGAALSDPSNPPGPTPA